MSDLRSTFELIQIPLDFIKWAKDQGVWDTITAASSLLISGFLFGMNKKKIPEFSVHLSYSIGTGHKNYPNVLNIELRNLMDSPLVIGRPNFKFGKGIPAGRYAHGNTATGDFEIKFRPIGVDGLPVPGYSYTHVMLRHREQAYSYLPLADEWTEEILLKMLEPRRWGVFSFKRSLGKLYLNVVLLKDQKPRVITMAIPIVHLQKGVEAPRLGREWD